MTSEGTGEPWIDAPDVLYAYKPLNEHSMKWLEQGELWFSSAREFNDPFDTAITYTLEGADTPMAELAARAATARYFPDLSERERDEKVREVLKRMRGLTPAEIESERIAVIKANYTKFGICSLTEVRDSLLMWGHYAQYHRGLCVGFDVNRLYAIADRIRVTKRWFLDIQQVQYVEKMPAVSFFEASLRGDDDSILDSIRMKSSVWSYEKEWRLVLWDHPNTALTFGPDVISEVVAGCKMQDADVARVKEVCRRSCPRAKLLRARTELQDFALRMEPL